MDWVSRCGLDRIASSPDTLTLVTVYVCSLRVKGRHYERGEGRERKEERKMVEREGESNY